MAATNSKAAVGITLDQLQEIKQLDKTVRSLTNLREELKDFKLGDVFIREYWYDEPQAKWTEKSHMGFPVKYQVCFVSHEGIPCLRKLAPNGKPTGDVVLPKQAALFKAIMMRGDIATAAGLINAVGENSVFTPDPEQLDSILLQAEFNPTADHKEKLKLFTDINKHNKRVAVNTNNYNSSYQTISTFVKNLKPGDKFWTSPDNIFVVQSNQKGAGKWDLKAIDKNQKIKSFTINSFMWKRLYREQPRSFARESAI